MRVMLTHKAREQIAGTSRASPRLQQFRDAPRDRETRG